MLGRCRWRVSVQRERKRPSRTLLRRTAFFPFSEVFNLCTSLSYCFILRFKMNFLGEAVVDIKELGRCASVCGCKGQAGIFRLCMEDKYKYDIASRRRNKGP